MKKLIILLSSLAALVLLGWYVMSLSENKGKSDLELHEFAFEDVSTIDKVIITDKYSRTFEIQKKGDIWTDKDGGCITQESAEFLMDAFQNIEFKGYIPDNSHDRYIKMMTAQHVKVEIFQNGEWAKTWYLGPPSPDHYGQIMLLEDKDQKSDIPVLMKIKGMNGIIEPRFFADKRLWACTNIFSVPIEEISNVDIKFYDEPERSFKVTKDGADLKVYQQGKRLLDAKPDMIFRYLNSYKKIHFNLHNFELTKTQVDSIKRSTPFATLQLKETNGKSTKLRMFRITDTYQTDADFGSVRDVNQDKFWCQLPDGSLVKCQYFVFNPLLLGHVYFPMDVSMLKTEDGIRVD
ncbi:MAG: hypothetical protein ACI837_003299 [Crocinitomicaceae bacterium]|jgi:hypothetical protein